MGEVVEFKLRKKKNTKKTAGETESRRGDTLCKSGHHKWQIETDNQFDVKAGKLVTSYRCKYCGKKKVKTH